MIFKIITYIFVSIVSILFLILYPTIGIIFLVKFYGKCSNGYLWEYNLISFIFYCTHFTVFKLLKYNIEIKTITSYFLCLLNISLIIWGICELYYNQFCNGTQFWVFGNFNLAIQFTMAVVFFSISLYNTCKACLNNNDCIEARIKNDYGSFNEV